MTDAGLNAGMWLLFAGSFRKNLELVLGMDRETAKATTRKAKAAYRKILAEVPPFEKKDRFQINLISCAMLGAFVLSMPQRPDVEQLTEYYAKTMMTPAMKWFCRQSGKQKFTPKDLRGMEETARLKAADRNPYSWNMDYYPYPDGSGYEVRFTACLTPVLCHLDYTMSEAGGASRFVRQYTLASGGPYCDCGYQKLHS